MPPKKKANKKGNDDWESELGETPNQDTVAAETNNADDGPKDADDEGMGGGLMAALRKNKAKKAKKGKPVQDDFIEGEDPPAEDGIDLAAKAATEATADDLFAAPAKGKGGKGKQQQVKAEDTADDASEAGGGGGLKTKKEKEKEKKEREKQRKKEQVRKCEY